MRQGAAVRMRITGFLPLLLTSDKISTTIYAKFGGLLLIDKFTKAAPGMLLEHKPGPVDIQMRYKI